MNNLEFMEKFKPKTRCIKEFEHWIVCIRAKQVTLGDAVILLKRQAESVGDILEEEIKEFPIIIKWYEEVCIKKFGAIKFNYMVLMMKDNFVHYHAFPRYDKNLDLFGIEWIDKDYPAIVNLKETKELSEEKLQEIKDYMSK